MSGGTPALATGTLTVLRDAAAMRAWSRRRRARGQRVALVPTMGALHAGHQALLQAARVEADAVVASIFVNPAQFGPEEDLERYPRTFEADTAVCAESGVDAIYAPPAAEVYLPDHDTWVVPGERGAPLEGEHRPGHFRGVLTVVLKLFNVVQPDVAFFGQKDAQQALLVRGMARDLDLPVTVHVRPTVREADGLALSSRNLHLDESGRRQALGLPRAVRAAVEALRRSETPAAAEAAGRTLLERAGVTVDYFRVVDLTTFRPRDTAGAPLLVAGAIRVGGTRLIDNATWPENALTGEVATETP